MSDKIADFQELQRIAEEIKMSWVKDQDKTDEMKKLTIFLKQITSKDSLEEYFKNDEKALSYFKNDFIEMVVKNILNQPYVYGKTGDDIALVLLIHIYKLFSQFHNKDYPKIFEGVRTIFKNSYNNSFFFPQNSINKSGNINEKKKYNFDVFNKIFCSDFIDKQKSQPLYNAGDNVDILINYSDCRTSIDQTAWVRGKVKKVEGGLYYIAYNGEESQTTLPIGSLKIQPGGTKTSDWDWRTNLKKYDLVDVFDREAWWPGTVCEIMEETDINGIKKVKYRIGFRLYLTHFNNKEDPNDSFTNYSSFWENKEAKIDEDSQEYIGDEKEKDEEIYHFSKRIQKFNSYSEIQMSSANEGDKEILESVNAELRKDDSLEDENYDNSILYEKNNKKNIIFGKSGVFSYYFASLLKNIEKIGDFDKYIYILKNSPKLDELYTIFTVLYNSLDYIHEQYIEDNKNVFKESFFKFANNLKDKDIKNMPKDFFELSKKFLSKIFKSNNENNFQIIQEENIEEEIALNFIFKMIKASAFDKRLSGVKDLNEQINKSQSNQKTLLRIANLIKQNNIINDIFGSNYHSQIISKAKDILHLLFKYEKLNEEEIKLIWGCTQKGDSETNVTIINMLTNLKSNFNEYYIGLLLTSILDNSDGKTNEKETDFVYSLSNTTKSPENKKIICNYFCQSIFKLTTFSKNNPVFEKLIKLMDNDENYLTEVLEICQNCLKENKFTLICNSLILELLQQFVVFNSNNDPNKPLYQCKKDCLTNFLKDEHLLKIFEQNFKDYVKKAKELCKSNNINNEEFLLIDTFNHDKNINGRLSFLHKLITKFYPNYDFILKLKDLLLDNPVFPEDKKYFYRFIENYCFPKNVEIINEIRNKSKISLFKIFTEKDQTEMTYSEFKLFLQSFIYLNSPKFNLKIKEKKIEEKYEDEFEITFNPNLNDKEIKEVQQLWKVLFEVKEENIIDKLINVIYQIIQDKKYIIDNITDVISKEENEEKIQKCYKLLELFLIESEKNLFIEIKSHYSLLKNCIIKFPLEIGEKKNKDLTEFFYGNTTLNEIKLALSKKYKIPINFIETHIIKENQKYKLDHKYNNKSLKEIVFDGILKNKKSKKINLNKIMFFSILNKEKEELIINKELSHRFKKILKKFYEEFTEGTGKMDKKMLGNYLLKVSDNLSNLEEKVKKIFVKYEKEEKGFLTEDNFYQFYYDLILENEKKVWNHVQKMGYNLYLVKSDEDLEVEHIKNNEDLFRYRLAIDEFIDEFIENYNNYPNLDYNLLFFYPTNQKIYEDILLRFNQHDSIFKDEKNILKQLYYFIIIESILQDIELSIIKPNQIFKNSNDSIQILSSNKYEPFDSYEIEKKVKFLEDFIINKNYEKLVKYNIDILNKYKKNKNELFKKCFRKGLKIMLIIYEACLDINSKNSDLIEDDFYFIDYSHISEVLKDKKEIKDKIQNYSYKFLYNNLIKYILSNSNNIDELYQDCFNATIKLLAFKVELLDNFFTSEENTKKSFYDLIINSLTSNPSSTIIKSLIDAIKKNSLISSSSENKFVNFLLDINQSIFDLMTNKENKNVFLSNQFVDFFTEFNDWIYKIKKDFNNKNLLILVEMLINNINESNTEKKLSNEVFAKYMELILKLIEKNPIIRKQITSYKIKDESLTQAILDKILLVEQNNNENNPNKNVEKENKFILIDQKKNEEEGFTFEKLKDLCKNYIFESIKDENDPEVIKEIIKINKIIRKKEESKLINNNQNNNNNMQANQKRSAYSLSKSLKTCGHVGLYNLGATCYMNSIMQQLYMVPTFRYAIMGADDKDMTLYYENYTPQDDNLLHQLQVMYTFLTLSQRQYYNPQYFCHSFKDFNGNPTNPKIQQDSQEFYNNFCEQIDKYLKKTKYKYIINDVFMGKTCSSVICDSCHHISNRFEDFYNLQLEVKNIKDLNESLQKLIIPEPIEGFKCEGCNKTVSIQKRTTLCKLPNTLVIHLKRFFMNYDLNTTQKINSKFVFPMVLKLKDFCIENFLKKDEKETDDIYLKNEEYYQYILKGINVHLGNAYGGHYISIIDTNREGKKNTMNQWKKKEKPAWVKFNDSNLSEFNINDIQYECYGGESKNMNYENSQSAYLLIYERVKKTPIKVLINSKEINDDQKKVIKYKKEQSNSITKKYDISKRNNEIKEEELYNLIFHNEEDNEFYKYIPYYDIPKSAPEKVYNKIMEDNNYLIKGKEEKKDNKIDEEIINKLKSSLNSKVANPISFKNMKESFSSEELIDLFKFISDELFIKAKLNNLTEKEKTEINDNMEDYLKNLIEPLINENANEGILKIIQESLITKNRVEIIFRKDDPAFHQLIVKEITECINKLIGILIYKNKPKLYDIFEIFLNYLKEVKSNPNYDGSSESNPIHYIYKIIEGLITNIDELAKKCVEENLISILIYGIEKEHFSNQEIIFNLLTIIIKQTKDYNALLSSSETNIKEEEKVEFINKKEIKKLFINKNDLLEFFFEKNSKLFFSLIKIFENNDTTFSNQFNIFCLQKLIEYSIKNDKLILFIELCYNIIEVKDENCIERMKQVLGFPTLIIKPKIINGKDENKNQKWPLFGSELIKKNNNDLKTEIYKYICFSKKKLCILSYLLPCESEMNENGKELLSDENIKVMIYKLISICLGKGGNYFIFKYLFLLPARSLYYKNAYEELINIIKDESNFKIDSFKNVEKQFIQKANYEINEIFKQRNPNSKKIKKIEKPELTKEIEERIPECKIITNYLGFIPDFIPGNITKEEIQLIAKTQYLELIRVEYFTQYYDTKEFKNMIEEKKDIEINLKNEKKIESVEKFDENEKILKVDISNEDYQRDENKLFWNISKKLETANKIIIEDGLIPNEDNIVLNSLVRYVLINKKPIKNRMEARIKLKKDLKIYIKDNICIPEYLFDYVDKHNYVDFLNINRIRKEDKFIQKEDILISVNSKAYFE